MEKLALIPCLCYVLLQLLDALRDAKLKILKELRPTTTAAAEKDAAEEATAEEKATAAPGTAAADESESLAQQLISELKSADPKYLPLLLECLRR